jgi:hypothetical protein
MKKLLYPLYYVLFFFQYECHAAARRYAALSVRTRKAQLLKGQK